MKIRLPHLWLFVPVVAALTGGCPPESTGPEVVDIDALRDPETCRDCHAKHVEEWEGSMHAYAAEDPLFLAMNARGQRETDGALGDFCIKCHAPLAVAYGLTTDGLNLDEVPAQMKGVTCYFCHSVAAAAGDHNNPLVLMEDGAMRGGIAEPEKSGVHRSLYSPLHDRGDLRSANLCGSCHDIVTPAGVHMERTFAEWRESLYSDPEKGALSCGQCHMRGRDDVVATVDGAPTRRVHSHAFPGVDVALTDFPHREEQRALIQRELDFTLGAQICVEEFPGSTEILIDLENVAAGHSWPSGSAPDRRAWVEIVAYAGDQVVWTIGDVADDEALVDYVADNPNTPPPRLRSRWTRATSTRTSSEPSSCRGSLLIAWRCACVCAPWATTSSTI
jgi:hypothetical protein